jgi:hypothetical protein
MKRGHELTVQLELHVAAFVGIHGELGSEGFVEDLLAPSKKDAQP